MSAAETCEGHSILSRQKRSCAVYEGQCTAKYFVRVHVRHSLFVKVLVLVGCKCLYVGVWCSGYLCSIVVCAKKKKKKNVECVECVYM